MASQKTIVGLVPGAKGGRLVVCAGTAKFVAKAKKVSLVVPFARLDSAVYSPRKALASAARTSMVGQVLYTTSTMYYTQLTKYRVTVSRLTGSISALTFNYQMIGH
jgi:hypothetical protein